MARKERKKEDLFIKEQRKSKNFFITSSAKMTNDKDRTSTTISSSVFTKMKNDFDAGDFLLDEHLISQNGSIIYMMQQMQEDLEDVYNEVSASAFQASYFPFATIDSGSFGIISSSLVPDKDNKYDLGAVGKEWNNLFIDGTANVDAINLNGTTISSTAAEINKLDGYTGDVNDLNYLKTLRATGVTNTEFDYLDGVTSNIQTQIDNVSGGGGGSGNYDTGSHLVPHADNTYDLGSSTKEWKNLYVDGTAYIDNLAGTTLTKPIRTVLNQVTKMKGTTLDASATDVFEFNIAKAFTIDLITPMFPGQEITIMNIGAGAITITRSQGGKAKSIYGSGNLTISQHEAYKFIVNQNQIWYVL